MSRNYKVVVTVPDADADKVRHAIGEAGGGVVGAYTYCSFSSSGTGRFLPGQNANPSIGSIGDMEQVAEQRIEINCTQDNIKNIVKAIRDVHPYEKPVIDIYPLVSEDSL